MRHLFPFQALIWSVRRQLTLLGFGAGAAPRVAGAVWDVPVSTKVRVTPCGDVSERISDQRDETRRVEMRQPTPCWHSTSAGFPPAVATGSRCLRRHMARTHHEPFRHSRHAPPLPRRRRYPTNDGYYIAAKDGDVGALAAAGAGSTRGTRASDLLAVSTANRGQRE